jgi:hypothetical protein
MTYSLITMFTGILLNECFPSILRTERTNLSPTSQKQNETTSNTTFWGNLWHNVTITKQWVTD